MTTAFDLVTVGGLTTPADEPTIPPGRQTALARAHETIRVLCDELELAQQQSAEKGTRLTETGDQVSLEQFEHLRKDCDQWRDTAEQGRIRQARTAKERDEAVRELAVLKRWLAELAGEST